MVLFGIKRGVIVTAILIAYFLLMKLFGLADNIWLRTLNAIILFGGVYKSIESWKSKKKDQLPYFNGLAVGIWVSAVVAIVFSIFLFAYLSYDTALMEKISSIPIFRLEFTPAKASLVIFFEAMFSGYIFSYMSMQFLKKSIKLEKK